jgi:hypothetical protein
MRNASRTAKILEGKKFIKREADRYDFSPKPAMLLSLTAHGTAIALLLFFRKDSGATRLLDRKTLDIVEEIASRWVEILPKVFGKWSFFRSERIDHIAADRLVYASYSIADTMESVGRAGHLWTPKKRGIKHDEHIEAAFTRFFYDLIYDPTFNRVAYLAKWILSLKDTAVDTRDSPLITWVQSLKKDVETQKHVSDNFRIAQAEIKRLEILSSLIGKTSSNVALLEEALVSVGKVLL